MRQIRCKIIVIDFSQKHTVHDTCVQLPNCLFSFFLSFYEYHLTDDYIVVMFKFKAFIEEENENIGGKEKEGLKRRTYSHLFCICILSEYLSLNLSLFWFFVHMPICFVWFACLTL